VGLDLGQSAEHTALAVVEDVPQQTPWGSTQHHLYVRHLERYPLRTSPSSFRFNILKHLEFRKQSHARLACNELDGA
jgi:hypothetical protein